MGFGSQARLNVHLHYHEKQAKKPAAHLADIDNNEDVELIILDAVKADDVDLVRDFSADVPRFSRMLLKQAVTSSSCEMLDVLLEACSSEQIDESTILDDAVSADNLEAARMLLSRGASLKYGGGEFRRFTGIRSATNNASPEMMKVLLSDRHIQEMIAKDDWAKPDFSWRLLHGVERSKDASFIQCLSLLPDWSDKRQAFEQCFLYDAKGCCSITIAEFLLRDGVDINSHDMEGCTALYWTSKRKSKRAADFLKFLLESGADPLPPLDKKRKRILYQPGPRNISKWFGITWEQLVEESRKKHAAALEMRPQ